jgi:hypothetical protein
MQGRKLVPATKFSAATLVANVDAKPNIDAVKVGLNYRLGGMFGN